MTDLSAPQTLNLFNSFAARWQETLGGQLLLLSSNGDLLACSNGIPPFSLPDVHKRVSPSKPGVITHSDHHIATAPLFRDNRTLGYLLAVESNRQDLSLLVWGADMIMSNLVGEEALRDMTDELIGAWNQLDLIYHVTENLALTTDLTAVLQSILEEIKKVVDTENGFILFKQAASLGCVSCGGQAAESPLCSEILLSSVIKADHIVLCETGSECTAFWPHAPASVESILATGLLNEDGVTAALGLINKVDEKFTAGDTKLLAALAQQLGAIIKNFLLHQNLIIEERLSRELEIAAEIQKSFLPTGLPEVQGLSIAVISAPASEVGGDFYDFITVDDRHLTVVIGDVAGKGIPAAMLTSVTRTMLRVEAMRGELPHSIIQQANNVLHQDLSRTDSFATVFVASIDTEAGSLSYASAGHMPALLWRAETGTIEQLKATSPPIGIFGYKGQPTRTVTLQAGDTIVFYTDGITEAQAPDGDFFGPDRLRHIIESKANEAPHKLQKIIQSEIALFRKESLSRDDATLLIIKMLTHLEAETDQGSSEIIRTINFSYPADIQHLTNISREITETCRQLPTLPSSINAHDFIYLIELAISEICTNVIKHAYAEVNGDITGRITLLSNGIQLDFYDQGASFDPDSIPQPNTDPYQLVEGGYGLHIVRQIMDVVSYDQDPERGNHWRLKKFLPTPKK